MNEHINLGLPSFLFDVISFSLGASLLPAGLWQGTPFSSLMPVLPFGALGPPIIGWAQDQPE